MKKILVLALISVCFVPCAFAKKVHVGSDQNSGYVGSPPNLNEGGQKIEQSEEKPDFEYKDGFSDSNSIKPAPRDNPAFINIIMKTDKTSQYINDLNSIISIIQNLQDCMEDDASIQKFNAESFVLKENVEYFRDKYKNKPEESYISFQKVMQLNTHVQALSQLRLEKEAYSPYLTSSKSGNSFSQNNINNQMDYLLKEVKDTLPVLKEAR